MFAARRFGSSWTCFSVMNLNRRFSSEMLGLRSCGCKANGLCGGLRIFADMEFLAVGFPCVSLTEGFRLEPALMLVSQVEGPWFPNGSGIWFWFGAVSVSGNGSTFASEWVGLAGGVVLFAGAFAILVWPDLVRWTVFGAVCLTSWLICLGAGLLSLS